MNKVIKNGLRVKLFKQKIQMTSKQFKRYLISQTTKEYRFKLLKFHHIPIIRNTNNNKYWHGPQKMETLIQCQLEGKVVQPLGSQSGAFSKNWKQKSAPEHVCKAFSTLPQRYLHIHVHCNPTINSWESVQMDE